MAHPHRNIVAIGTSAGGVDALQELTRQLPASFDAAVLVTLHLSETYPSELDRILTRSGPLPARFARGGERLKTGQIYIAPRQRHLLLMDGDRLELGLGPRENNARPAIDPMFRSVALCCGARGIGVVLSGMLGDGAAGLLALKQQGAITVVQEPSDAAFAEMPSVAVQRADPDHVVTLAGLPALLAELVQQPAGNPVAASDRLRFEVEIARVGHFNGKDMDAIGKRSVLACPDCHGVMWEVEEGNLVRYRCHVGHAHTAESMQYALDENLGRALATALRALDERIALAEKLRDKAIEGQHQWSIDLWQRRLDETQRDAKIIREAVMRRERIWTEKADGD